MKIYVDVVLFLNLAFDFILLLTVSTILKRKVKIFKLLIGSFFGSLTTLLLFIKLSSFGLFFLKVIVSIFMIIISFGFKNIRYFFKNMLFLYMSSIMLGGFLYFLNIQFSYKNAGLIFFHNGLSVNFIVLIIMSPIILYFYIRTSKSLKNNYNYYHDVKIYLEDDVISCVGYLDTGNKIVDPYFKRSIIFINEDLIKNESCFNILVPYQTIGNKGLINCINPKKIEIDGTVVNMLVGISKEKIKIDGVDCILPNIEEGIC